MLTNPSFIRGRSFVRTFYDLLDNGSDDDLLKLKIKLKSRKVLLDDLDVLQKCDEFVKYIDEELLLREDLEFVEMLEKLQPK